MTDFVVKVVPEDPDVVGVSEDMVIQQRTEDLKVTIPVNDMVIVPKIPDLSIAVRASDLAVAVTDIGPPGPAGAPGSGVVPTLISIATTDIGGNRVVKSVVGGVDIASCDVPLDGDQVIGITQGAAMQGSPVSVQLGGIMFESSWNWIVGGLIFLGINGVPTQTPPTIGVLVRLGKAVSANEININVEEAILLV